jgi:hypothetical protein
MKIHEKLRIREIGNTHTWFFQAPGALKLMVPTFYLVDFPVFFPLEIRTALLLRFETGSFKRAAKLS